VVVCEAKLLLHDMNTRKPFEVPRASLDNKTPTCVAFLFRGGPHAPGGQPGPAALMTSPVLAVGCSDGAVRLLHLATLRVRRLAVWLWGAVGSGWAAAGRRMMWDATGAAC
jgi:hypothetical protein